jgi:hypothetical protein
LTTFSVATNEYRGGSGERTEYHACVAWDRLAEITGQFLSKGQLVDVEGRLQTRQWDDDAGKRQWKSCMCPSPGTSATGRGWSPLRRRDSGNIGVTVLTLGRILGTTSDDLIAVQGMARVRRGYLELAPYLEPYFTHGTSDDVAGVMRTYRVPERRLRAMLHAFSTSTGMIMIIVSLVGGMLAGVVAMLVGIRPGVAFGVGALATLVAFAGLAALAARYFARDQAEMEVRFPSARTADPPVVDADEPG